MRTNNDEDLAELVARTRLNLTAWLKERRQELQTQLQYGSSPAGSPHPAAVVHEDDIFGDIA